MRDDRLLRYAGISAYLSGAAVLAGIPLLVVAARGGAVEAPVQAVGLVVFLAMLPVALALRSLAPPRAAALGLIALVVIVIGASGGVALGLLVLLHVITDAQRARPAIAAFGAVGLWLVIANGPSAPAGLPRPLARLGLAVGTAFVLTNVAVWSGVLPTGTLGPSQITPLAVAAGVMAALAIYVGYPAWVILLGRRLRGGTFSRL